MKFYDQYGILEDGEDHAKHVVEDISNLGVTAF